jgi:hypothetical protein
MAGARLWIHVQDFEVEAALATGLMDDKRLSARLARWVEATFLKLGDHVSTISPQMCAKLVDKGVAPVRVFEMRNWSDARFAADPAGAEAVRAAWGLTGKVVALYAANSGRSPSPARSRRSPRAWLRAWRAPPWRAPRPGRHPGQLGHGKAIGAVRRAIGQFVQQHQIALPFARADMVERQRLAGLGQPGSS